MSIPDCKLWMSVEGRAPRNDCIEESASSSNLANTQVAGNNDQAPDSYIQGHLSRGEELKSSMGSLWQLPTALSTGEIIDRPLPIYNSKYDVADHKLDWLQAVTNFHAYASVEDYHPSIQPLVQRILDLETKEQITLRELLELNELLNRVQNGSFARFIDSVDMPNFRFMQEVIRNEIAYREIFSILSENPSADDYDNFNFVQKYYEFILGDSKHTPSLATLEKAQFYLDYLQGEERSQEAKKTNPPYWVYEMKGAIEFFSRLKTDEEWQNYIQQFLNETQYFSVDPAELARECPSFVVDNLQNNVFASLIMARILSEQFANGDVPETKMSQVMLSIYLAAVGVDSDFGKLLVAKMKEKDFDINAVDFNNIAAQSVLLGLGGKEVERQDKGYVYHCQLPRIVVKKLEETFWKNQNGNIVLTPSVFEEEYNPHELEYHRWDIEAVGTARLGAKVGIYGAETVILGLNTADKWAAHGRYAVASDKIHHGLQKLRAPLLGASGVLAVYHQHRFNEEWEHGHISDEAWQRKTMGNMILTAGVIGSVCLSGIGAWLMLIPILYGDHLMHEDYDHDLIDVTINFNQVL